MPSEIDIANLALGHLGDDATVTNFNPPEGSAQAEHCARWYPIARDSLLEQHDFGFATRRATLAQLVYTDPTGEWAYAYALPNLCIKPVEVYPSASASNVQLTSYPLSSLVSDNGSLAGANGIEFTVETDDNGNKILLTNQPNAALLYIAQTTDTNKFSPLFVDTLGWYLASYLAGPVLKGDVGRAEAKGCLQIALGLMGKATVSDANQRRKTQASNPTNSITGSR